VGRQCVELAANVLHRHRRFLMAGCIVRGEQDKQFTSQTSGGGKHSDSDIDQACCHCTDRVAAGCNDTAKRVQERSNYEEVMFIVNQTTLLSAV
jgi:hypothetical protein